MNTHTRTVLTTALVLAVAPSSLWAQQRAAEVVPPTVERRPTPYPVIPIPPFQQAIQKGTRTRTGEPGPRYWQQWTDYSIRARLTPDDRRIRGTVRIMYHNRSPDQLPILALYLLQNVHAEGAERNRPAEVTGGIDLTKVAVGGQPSPVRPFRQVLGRDRAVGHAVQGTMLYVRPPQPVRSKDSVELVIDWSFRIPQRGAGGRMGWSADNLFYMAYWYPQMAVYDDVFGWHTDQFLGNAEFYMGYGTYDIAIEAPEGWLIMATGELMNPEQVLPPAILQRYRHAHDSDSVVHVLTAADFGAGKATTRSQMGYVEWRFRSDSVRDVAFSATKESLWDAARTPVGDRDGDGNTDYALVNAIYRTTATHWDKQWRFARHSIDFLSRWTGFPYPWPHMTSVEGNGLETGGMEYPMMTLMGGYDNAPESALYGVTAHELAHMWVPMIVGTDERRHSWMDEGTTSFNGGHAENEFYPSRDHTHDNREGYLFVARASLEGEIMRHSDFHYPGPAYGTASYSKPATLLNTLRGLLGAGVFDPAYRDYIRTWAYKHPKPWDFFNHFNAASGQSLDWFWRTWYYETWTLDQAVGSVRPGPNGTTIIIEDRGWAPMPARVTITRQDGETFVREIPVETWLGGETRAEIVVASGSPLVRVEIDAAQAFPDTDRRNNVWDRDRR